MQQLSISDIQRNLHKLDSFDVIEVIDKKRNKIKGYFLDNKYASLIQELMTNEMNQKENSKHIAGSLHQYANPELIEDENRGWKDHMVEKYQ